MSTLPRHDRERVSKALDICDAVQKQAKGVQRGRIKRSKLLHEFSIRPREQPKVIRLSSKNQRDVSNIAAAKTMVFLILLQEILQGIERKKGIKLI